MLGAILAIFPRQAPMDQRVAQVLGAAGLGLIAYAILFYSEQTPFPGAAALAPCVGAALILYTGQRNMTLAGRLLSTNAFRYPGLISYSLYLWHWPVLVFYKKYAITPISQMEIAMLVVAMTVAAWASWKFVEAPFRTRNVLAKQKSLFAVGGGVMLASAACGAIIGLNDGLLGQMVGPVNRILEAKNDMARLGSERIIIPAAAGKAAIRTMFIPIGAGNPGKATFAVWGDSHAVALAPGVSASAAKFGHAGIFIGADSCPPLIGAETDQGKKEDIDECKYITSAFMDYLSEHPEIKHILLISRWALYATGEWYKNEYEGRPDFLIRDQKTVSMSKDENKRVFKRSLGRTFERLSLLGRSIILVTDVPETGRNIPDTAARAMLSGHDIELRPRTDDYRARQAFVASVFDENKDKYDLMFIRPHEKMCGKEYCDVFDGGVPIYFDDDHITQTYALKLSYLFDPIFQSLKSGGAPPRRDPVK